MNILDLYSYDYILPESQIAQYPTQPQHDCKLLYCKIDNDSNPKLEDKIFKNIVDLIDKDSQIYFNNSKVVPSRIYISTNNFNDGSSNIKIIGSDGSAKQIDSGELFWLRQISDDTHEFLVRPGSKLKTGTKIHIESNEREYIFEILGNTTEGREVRLQSYGVTELDSDSKLDGGKVTGLGNSIDKNNHVTIPPYNHVTNIYDILEKFGNIPLPPYIGYDKSKDNDYQPVFAKTPGSVASPTASLHFTNHVMHELDKKGIGKNFVTLHVGMGTFKSVESEDITKHNIHGEIAEIDIQIFQDVYIQKSSGQKIISVGTTSARTMESLPYLFASMYTDLENKNILTSRLSAECIARWYDFIKDLQSDYIYNIKKYGDSVTFETRIYIYPGYMRIIVDNLVTNFHLPKSSLMMLVASKMGYENMMKAYKHAIYNDYRFYSFGDAMYIELD